MKPKEKLDSHEEILEWEFIDPDTAFEYLETMQGMNRPVKSAKLKQYIEDWKSGNWLRTTTPIKFDRNGRLFDGQHRLWMLIEVKESFWFVVARNCDPKERQVQDIGAPRSVKDVFAFEGVKVRTIATALANQMARSYQPHFRPSVQQQRENYMNHKDAVEWVLSLMPSRLRGIGQAGILAPVARAWYTEDHDKLARFLEVLKDGIPKDESEHVIILLRNHALSAVGYNRGDNVEGYGKCERALRAFLDGDKISRLYAETHEVFPIPGEPDARPKVKRTTVLKVANGRK